MTVPALPPVSSVTPLKHDRFALELQGHPDQERVSYVLNGIRLGFKLGFDHAPDLRSAKRNKKSADDHPTVIDEYLANEVALGRVAGPFAHPPIPQLHISSFGVIPKNGQPGKWRLIVDLSSPAGSSVNDGIDVDSFSLQYIRVDDIVKMVSKCGFGALIAKFDVLAAYRNVAIHPSDRALLGMRWRGLPTAGSVGPTVTDPNTKSSVGGSHFASLELRCRELLLQGLAPSTRRSYATGQKRFINFCTQLGK
ncbi:hypothetical protein QZH41_001030, partial [Actinostola sp. cb2023]